MRVVVLLSVFCLIFTVSCSTNDDPSGIRLSSFEKGLIPFDSEVVLEFTDQDGETLSVQAGARQQDEVFASSSGSNPVALEQLSNQIVVPAASMDFVIQVGKTIDGKTNFLIREQVTQQSFNATSCETRVSDLAEYRTDLLIGETMYPEVFDFVTCNSNEDAGLEINRIIYSAARGIEYIEFGNGHFLRQL
jgi:hypothetical protein